MKSSIQNFVFQAPPVASVAVHGTDARFPVRRIFCVGRNYEAHAREMGKDPTRDPPFFFMKPSDAVIDDGESVPYPPETNDFQHEIELVVAIGADGANIPESEALDHIFGYAVGIDLTRRDLQLKARDQGRPWDWGKAFDHSAPIAPIRTVREVGHPATGRIWLSVNGQTKQSQDIADLIWSVPEIIAIASRSMKLMKGDLIMTGTPAGVSPIVVGDRVEGGIDGLGTITIMVGSSQSKAG